MGDRVQDPETPPRMLLVHPDAALVHRAVRAGLDVLVLTDGNGFVGLAPERVHRAGESGGTEAGIGRLVANQGITHVLDADGSPAWRIPPGSGPVVTEAPRLLADVRAFRQALASSLRAVVREHLVPVVDEVPKAVADLGGKATIVTASGEDVVDSDASLNAWMRTRRHRPAAGPFLVEELVTGAEVVVTTLTVSGMHRVVGIVEHHRIGTRARYLYPANLPEPGAQQVRALVTGMLDTVGYEFGPAHTRVVLTAGGPRLVSAAPRFTVHGIAGLIETATGFDLATELFRALAGAPIEPPRARWYTAAEFGGTSGPADAPRVAEAVSADAVWRRLDELP
nr:hypothetical protein [Amycolatopsis sp.]